MATQGKLPGVHMIKMLKFTRRTDTEVKPNKLQTPVQKNYYDGWAKNQLGERRLGKLFFGRQTIGR